MCASAAALIPDSQPICLAVDDSLFPRTGPHIHGVSWRRDPLGPKFHTNFIRAQRFLQFSMAVPTGESSQGIRMIPVDFLHCPTPTKPGKKTTDEQRQQYRRDCRTNTLTKQASKRLSCLCASLPPDSKGQPRHVHLLGDGQYTNATILKHLPPRSTFIGRIRKDAKLYHLPVNNPESQRGRRRIYGDIAPTPEQIRTDDSLGWETISVFAAGASHECRVKTVTEVLWRTAGPQVLKLVVVAPIHYRPRKGSKLLYRNPAFLISTDPQLSTQQIVQEYVGRWDVEVNFREEKSLIGVADAQVRTPTSTQLLPAFRIAIYSLLLLAGIQAAAEGGMCALPPPKWSKQNKPQRTSTQRLIQILRAEVWRRGLGLEENFSGFLARPSPSKKPEILPPSLPSALLYCNA